MIINIMKVETYYLHKCIRYTADVYDTDILMSTDRFLIKKKVLRRLRQPAEVRLNLKWWKGSTHELDFTLLAFCHRKLAQRYLMHIIRYGGQTLTIKCADLEYIYEIKHIDNNYLNDNGGNDGFCSKPTGYVLIDSKLFFFEICKPFIAKYLFCFTILN